MSLKMSLGCISPAEDGPWCPLNMVWKSLLSKLKLKHITVQELFAALRCNSKKKKKERKEEKAGCIVFVATQKCPFSFYKPKPRERFVGVFRKSADPQWGWIFQNPQDEFSEVWLSGNKKKKEKMNLPKARRHAVSPVLTTRFYPGEQLLRDLKQIRWTEDIMRKPQTVGTTAILMSTHLVQCWINKMINRLVNLDEINPQQFLLIHFFFGLIHQSKTAIYWFLLL